MRVPELVTQLYLDIPDAGEHFSVGVLVGFIATVPATAPATAP